MADALKRISMSKDKSFQDRCAYYLLERAKVVLHKKLQMQMTSYLQKHYGQDK